MWRGEDAIIGTSECTINRGEHDKSAPTAGGFGGKLTGERLWDVKIWVLCVWSVLHSTGGKPHGLLVVRRVTARPWLLPPEWLRFRRSSKIVV
jgi:hypothetical protein